MFFSPFLTHGSPLRATIDGALLLVGVSMLFISAGQGLPAIALLCSLVGLGSAFAHMPMPAPLIHRFHNNRTDKSIGFMVT